MRRYKKLLAVAVPVATMLTVMVPAPGQAATVNFGAATVTGSGTISPGLTATPTPQTVTFTGNVTGTLTTAAPPQTAVFSVNCIFQGASNNGPVITGDSAALGQGNVNGTCTGTATVVPPGAVRPVGATCSLKYYREGTDVTVEGTCTITINNTAHRVCATGELVFVPTDTGPTTSYQLAGDVTLTPPPTKTPCPASTKV